MTDKIDRVLSLSRKGYLSAEFITDSYRLSGEVNLKNQPLVDLLNDKMSNFIRVENVFISPIADPTVIKAHLTFGQVRKDTILAVILAREEDGPARHTLYGWKADAPILYNLYAAMTGFEIRGGLKIGSPADIDGMLMQSPDRFTSIYRASAVWVANTEIQFAGGAILLNREKINVYNLESAMSKERRPASTPSSAASGGTPTAP